MTTSLGRLLLVVINVLLMIISLVMVVAGFIMKYGSNLLTTHFSTQIDTIKSKVSGVFGSTNANSISASNFDISTLMGTVGTVLILVGFFLLVISFFGFFGACCKVRSFLLLYAVILTVLLIGQIVFIGLLYDCNDTMKTIMKNQMNTLLEDYQGLNGTNAQSLAWNFVMMQLSCCGVNNYEDFKSGTKWWGTQNHVTPLACCNPLPTTSALAKSCAGDVGQTVANLNTATNNYNKGCLDKIWEYAVYDNKLYVVLGVTGLFLFQFLMIVFALLLYCKKNDDAKVRPESHDSPHRTQHRSRRPDW